jgi:NTE family protein
MNEMESFLATVAIFRELTPEQLREVAPLCRQERYAAGTTILSQGAYSEALYFLHSGRLAIRVRRGDHMETVAHLQPPAVFGELSFITGRACSADVQVVVDAEVVMLSKSAMGQVQAHRDKIIHGMMNVVAERLHDTVTQGAKAPESPVIVLRNLPNWEAPYSFAAELGKALSRESGSETLVVNLIEGPPLDIRPLTEHAFTCSVKVNAVDDALRADSAQRLTEWKTRFTNVILNPVGPRAIAIAERIDAFADSIGKLAGPGDDPGMEPGATVGPGKFIVQSAAKPGSMTLSGNQQLIWEAAEAEQAWRAGQPAGQRFVRTVNSIARSIVNLQVGLALGGGAAWGWAHIGMLEKLEKAGLPIDVVSGCSMGSVVGALHCSGVPISELLAIAEYWRTRTRRFIEWRLWRMSLISDNVARKVFAGYFGERPVNHMEIPYWANAVDIKTGHEFTIQDGPIVDCIRASISLPGLFPPIARGKHLLVDAGIMDPVPVNLVRRMGARYVVAVNAMAALEGQELSKRFPMLDVMLRCTRIMGHEIGQARAEESANIVVTPTLGKITMLDFARSSEIIECGRRAAEANLPAIMAGYERLKPRHVVAQTS